MRPTMHLRPVIWITGHADDKRETLLRPVPSSCFALEAFLDSPATAGDPDQLIKCGV